MKKVISLKEIVLILLSLILITFLSNVYANEGLVVGSGEYNNAQYVQDENNVTNSTNNIKKNVINNNSSNNITNTNNTALPQTGIEDYNIGILLIICIASAMYAYKKMSDYKKI